MKSIIYKYGFISSVLIVLFMIASTVLFIQMDNEPLSMTLGFAGMLVGFASIFIALEKYKKAQGGTLSFMDGLKIGGCIALLGSLSYTLVWMLEFQFVFPDFMDKFSASQIEHLHQSKLSPDVIASEVKKIQEMAVNYKNPVYRFGITLVEILPIGLFITFLAAIILRKKPKA
ncbi:MAG: hypothetical protein RL607_2534 [Bacteroidota bacterium]